MREWNPSRCHYTKQLTQIFDLSWIKSSVLFILFNRRGSCISPYRFCVPRFKISFAPDQNPKQMARDGILSKKNDRKLNSRFKILSQ